MSDTPDPAAQEQAPPKRKSKALLFGAVAALLLGGGSFYGVYSGMIPLPFGDPGPTADAQAVDAEGAAPGSQSAEAARPVAFIPLEEMVISLGPDSTAKHLKVRLTIEVEPEKQESVRAVTPRILDVMNTFLRAVDESEFEQPRSMLRLRAQMLRRVQLVTPEGAVRDLLIQEFLLN